MRRFLIPKEGAFSLTVRNRGGLVYEGEVYALSSYNAKGSFDVLPLHANFISLIRDAIRIYKKDGTQEDIRIDAGVLRVRDNKAEVYLGIVH